MANSWLILFVIFTSLYIYMCGLAMDYLNKSSISRQIETPSISSVERQQAMQSKKHLAMWAVILILTALVLLKYTPFIITNINNVLALVLPQVSIPLLKFVVPLGISFYSLQAISYCVDVYRGTIEVEKNPLKLALYLTFFPTIMQGPITRYKAIQESLFAGYAITAVSLTNGVQRITWGLFKKIVIADRLNSLVVSIIDVDNAGFSGSIILIGALVYTIQLYMDFSGIVDISLGTAEIFNITLPENFRQPFFATTVVEFWKRWHVTLGLWLKDYVFYPVMLSRHMKQFTKRTRRIFGKHTALLITNIIALFAVWFCNGLWHGTGWNYLLYGMYYFMLISLSVVCAPVILLVKKKLHINDKSVSFRIFQGFKMITIIVIGELIFRVESIWKILSLAKNVIFKFEILDVSNGFFERFSFNIFDFWIGIVAIILVLIVDIMKEKKIDPRRSINSRPILIRWTLSYLIILFIVIFGAYGPGYTPVDIIYAGF